MKRIILISACLFLAACTDPNGARKALAHQGIKATHVGGYAWLSCSDHDTFKTHFDGIDAQGNPVSGAVCRGRFKNSTIRYDY